MSLPPTIQTKHGEYRWDERIARYKSKTGWAGVPRGTWESRWEFSFRMSTDEVIEFLQAYKEATNE